MPIPRHAILYHFPFPTFFLLCLASGQICTDAAAGCTFALMGKGGDNTWFFNLLLHFALKFFFLFPFSLLLVLVLFFCVLLLLCAVCACSLSLSTNKCIPHSYDF
jgi:hypothetical protein